MFWLLCGLLGMNLLQTPGQEGLIKILLWIALVLVSILWHEFGHAIGFRKCGQPNANIVLHGFGGYCQATGSFTRGQSMFISFAGPLASFILGGLFWLLTKTPAFSAPDAALLRWLVAQALWVNIGWALLNLLPIFPLDGGQIFAAFMANKKPKIVPIVGMVVAGAVAVYGLVGVGSLWMALMFGFLAYQNWQRSKGLPTTRLF